MSIQESMQYNSADSGLYAAPIFWPSDMKSRLIGKDPDAGKD